jgi:iron(III) transport system permease protein
MAGLGYALPGSILALGLLFVLAGFDNSVDAMSRDFSACRRGCC